MDRIYVRQYLNFINEQLKVAKNTDRKEDVHILRGSLKLIKVFAEAALEEIKEESELPIG